MIAMVEKPEIDDRHIQATYKNISSQVLELLHYEIMFTLQQRRQGAVVIHLIICIYAFASLAILCDEYFCASLNKICKRLNIHPDVAGATFMAAGSSMPTMFISVTSVFLDEGDIGLGTIIGSTMFNILFITGTCGLATSVAVELKPYSIIRDALYYVMYLTVLLVTMYDGMIHWYEASFVTLLYGFYVVIMYYNSTLEHHFNAWAKTRIHQTRLPHGSPAKSPPNHPQSNQSIEKSPTVVASKSSDELPDSPSSPFTSVMVGVEKVDPVEVDDQFNMCDERSVCSNADSSPPHTKYDEDPVDSLNCPSER